MEILRGHFLQINLIDLEVQTLWNILEGKLWVEILRGHFVRINLIDLGL